MMSETKSPLCVSTKIQELQDQIFNLVLEIRQDISVKQRQIESLEAISELLEVVKDQ